jgi:hypothetical protein
MRNAGNCSVAGEACCRNAHSLTVRFRVARLVIRLIKQVKFDNHAQGRIEPPLPTNYNNFVDQQNGHRRQGGPDGQGITSEEVQGHTYPAKANSYQGTTNIRRSDCCRESGTKDVLEPKKLS